MKRTDRARLAEVMRSFKELSVMVIGDYALDVYWYADMARSELSRETPHYTRPITRETYSPGASGNICCNLKGIGVKEVLALTVIGQDWRGKILADELNKAGVGLEHIIMSQERVTSTYIKPMLCGLDSQQEDSRLDFVNREPISRDLENQLIAGLQLAVSKVDAVIVEDQMISNGIVTDRVRDSLIQIAEKHPKKIFVSDSRDKIGLFKSMVLKPNIIEVVRAVRPSRNPKDVGVEELKEIGVELQKKARRPVYITLSEKGALLITDTLQQYIPAAPTEPPIDPVGAGDTFMSAIAASLAGGADPTEAGIIANLAAGVIVKKLNTTGTASPNEIIQKFDSALRSEEWSCLIG